MDGSGAGAGAAAGGGGHDHLELDIEGLSDIYDAANSIYDDSDDDPWAGFSSSHTRTPQRVQEPAFLHSSTSPFARSPFARSPVRQFKDQKTKNKKQNTSACLLTSQSSASEVEQIRRARVNGRVPGCFVYQYTM